MAYRRGFWVAVVSAISLVELAGAACSIQLPFATHGSDASDDRAEPTTSDAAPTSLDGGPTSGDAAPTFPDGGFTSGDGAHEPLPPRDDCDGGCASDEYCSAIHYEGGGRRILGYVDAARPAGCHPLPAACADAATCPCVLAQTDAASCHGSSRDCIVEDSGAIVERCIIILP